MTAQSDPQPPTNRPADTSPMPAPTQRRAVVSGITVGFDGFTEGRDAVVLGAAIARATGAALMLVAVQPAPPFPFPGWNWKVLHTDADRSLRQLRRELAPDARTTVELGWSIPSTLDRVAQRERHDLLVVGSSRQARAGHVRIGSRTRELLSLPPYALAVAPRGLHAAGTVDLTRIGVGYDGGRESAAAVAVAGAIAAGAGARLLIRAVVDDRIPEILQTARTGFTPAQWSEAAGFEEERLRNEADELAAATGADAEVTVTRGRPASSLLELSEASDLLVVGSRRWGPAARVLLGSTGEALMHEAACAVLAVPRPRGAPAPPDEPPPGLVGAPDDQRVREQEQHIPDR